MLTPEFKAFIAKSVKVKLAVLAIIAAAGGYFYYVGNKEAVIKIVEIAGEVIAVPEDTQILSASTPVTVQYVSESTFISATVPNTPAK